MKYVGAYCVKVKKKTERLLKKMFGYKTLAEGLSARTELIKWLEISSGKDIDKFDMNDVRRYGCLYVKYRTLDKILSIYIDLVSLNYFTEKEF